MLDIVATPYQMRDRQGLAFLVDEEFEHLIRHKHIWTYNGIVMVEIYTSLNHRGRGARSSENIPIIMPLARFVLETYLMLMLLPEKQIRHINKNPRNLLFSNLEVV